MFKIKVSYLKIKIIGGEQMIRGLYTSAQSMAQDERRMEVISNNLANMNTNGYKKDTAVTRAFNEVMADVTGSNQVGKNNNKLILDLGIDDVATNYKAGSTVQTGNKLDFAIGNSDLAMFAVDVPSQNGTQEMYTRDGSFTLNDKGQLVTKDGNTVKGEKGPIVLNGSDITVNSDGAIVQNGTVVDKLLIKEFNDSKTLKKYGNNLISADSNTQTKPFSGQIIQGSVESSNINSITEMVDMISVMRSYEASQKVLQAHDSTLQKAANEIGKI